MASNDSESMLSAGKQARKPSSGIKHAYPTTSFNNSKLNSPRYSSYDSPRSQPTSRTADKMEESELDAEAENLLQQRLREAKANRLQDGIKAKGGNRLLEDTRETQSSPVIKHQSRSRKSDIASSITTRVGTGDLQRNLGIKAMEEVCKLHRHRWLSANSFAETNRN